jgi:hypothetical protein
MARQETLAAVDLGSNSFHLQIGRVVDGQIYPLDTLREVVRIGAGLTADKRIDRATQARALEALERIGGRLRGLPKGAVRAVGTNALRVAKKRNRRTGWRRRAPASSASSPRCPTCAARSTAGARRASTCSSSSACGPRWRVVRSRGRSSIASRCGTGSPPSA